MSDAARVHVVLELSPALRTALGSGEPGLRPELTAGLQQLLDDLGLPAAATAEIVTLASARPFRLRIGHESIACAPALVSHLARAVGLPDDFRTRLENDDEALAADALRTMLVHVCTSALAGQADRLVTPDLVAAYRARHSAAAAIDPHQLGAVLRALLVCGISIADGEVIGERLATDRGAGRSQRASIESLIALFRPLVLDLEVAPDAATGVLQGLGPEPRAVDQAHLVEDSVELFQLLRDGMFWELGIRIPPVRIAVSALPPGTFACRINHRRGRVWRALRADEHLVNEATDRLSAHAIEPIRPAINPASGQPCSVIAAADAGRAASLGLTTWSALGYIILCVAAEVRANAHAFIDIDEVEASVSELDAVFPGIAAEVTADGLLEHTSAVLRELLTDEISIRDLRRIIDAVVTTDHVYADSSQIVFDDRVLLFTDTRAEMLGKVAIAVAQARKRLNRYVTHKHTRGQNTLVVLLLDPTSVEEPVARHLAGLDPLESDWLERLCAAIDEETSASGARPALLTTAPVAMFLRPALRHGCPDTPVVAYDELAPDVNIQPLARVDLATLPAFA